jgi:hypothetical protein
MKTKNYDSFNNPKFLEFYGIMIGDGCLSKYVQNYDNCERKVVCVTGNAIKDYAYVKEYVSFLVERTYKFKPYIKIDKKQNEIVIYITNKKVFHSLESYGFPVGKKGEIYIPRNILKFPFKKVAPLLRGIFDTDGCISAVKSSSYQRTIIFLSSKSLKLRKQLKFILEKQGFSVYLSKEYVSLSGNKNLKKWFKLIGSSNPRNLLRYEEWCKTGRIASIGLNMGQ